MPLRDTLTDHTYQLTAARPTDYKIGTVACFIIRLASPVETVGKVISESVKLLCDVWQREQILSFISLAVRDHNVILDG